MSVNSKMTAIADKIRTMLGLSGTMGLDAMATNLDTANTAVDDALAALVEKGVEVPDGTNVTGLAALIAAIESGGAKVATGNFTISSDVKYFEVSHGLGTTPIILLFWVTTYVNTSNSLAGGIGVASGVIEKKENIPIYCTGTAYDTHAFYPGETKTCDITGNVTGNMNKVCAFTSTNKESFYIGSTYSSYNYYLRSGKTYKWVAIA